MANIVRYVITDFAGFDELAAKEDIEEESYLKIAKLVAILRVANALDRSHKQKIREMKASLKGKPAGADGGYGRGYDTGAGTVPG